MSTAIVSVADRLTDIVRDVFAPDGRSAVKPAAKVSLPRLKSQEMPSVNVAGDLGKLAQSVAGIVPTTPVRPPAPERVNRVQQTRTFERPTFSFD